MRYPVFYVQGKNGDAVPITDMPEFSVTLSGDYAYKGVEPAPLYVRHSDEDSIAAVVSLIFIKPENYVESCSACVELNVDGSERGDTGESAMIAFSDEFGRVEALCYGCSIGLLAWV